MEGILGMGKLALGNGDEAHWLPCDGRLLDRAGYPELYAMLGDKFGGDGKEKFALPKTEQQPAGQFYIKVKPHPFEKEEQLGFITQFALWAQDEAPEGWLRCDGSTLQSKDYPLFSELAFLGHGAVTPSFSLPDLPDNGGMKFIICVEGKDPRVQE